MADPPSYPRAGEDAGDASRPALTARQRGVRVLLIAVVVALIALVVILHVTGVLGPGAHG
jgi:hypothetical protein